MSEYDNLLKQIRDDYYQAITSWLFFMQGNGSFDEGKKELLGAINTQNLGPAYNFVQNVTVANCIISICRLTDRHSAERVNLTALHALVKKDRERLIDLAKQQFSTEDAMFRDQLVEKATIETTQTIDVLLSNIGALLDSASLKEIRNHRNAVLAHSLSKKPDPPKISAVQEVLKSLRPILVDAHLILKRTSLVVEIAEEDFDRIFAKFWNAVEYGAIELEKQKKAKIEQFIREHLPKQEDPEGT